ncbi:hypothetical protein A4X09_0g5392 [Tilletia walkeri]|uniref:GAG-pre-integrase domain-containing protein n=1 Tax=Tilletia walkeri TaxID=117179 RepID=A0A8X7N4K4_9BASI|nr:hypothetical protein A4X09_0g5392 [Tilletia walkeri]
MPVLAIGTITVCMGNEQRVSLRGTAYVPSAVTNLLSVDKMVEEGFEVSFSDGGCRIARPDESCVIIATRKEGQYTVTACEHNSVDAALTAVENVTKAQAQALLEHERLCRLNVDGMRKMARMGLVPGLSTDIPDLPFCEECAAGKQSKPQLPDNGNSRAPRPLHTIAFDVVGPIDPAAPAALGGARYALNGTDSQTRFRWTKPLQFKSEVTKAISDLIYPSRRTTRVGSSRTCEVTMAQSSSTLNSKHSSGAWESLTSARLRTRLNPMGWRSAATGSSWKL